MFTNLWFLFLQQLETVLIAEGVTRASPIWKVMSDAMCSSRARPGLVCNLTIYGLRSADYDMRITKWRDHDTRNNHAFFHQSFRFGGGRVIGMSINSHTPFLIGLFESSIILLHIIYQAHDNPKNIYSS